MSIKSYTTKAPAMQSVTKVQEALVAHGAVSIQTMYDADKRISALQFALPFKDGRNIAFSLPCAWRRFQEVLHQQNMRRGEEDGYAYRVAWANIRDWVASQMALYETQMVDMPQIFLPFAVGKDGKTLYDHMQTNPSFLLGHGSNPI
jgi:hypothetical protein